ncbi:MAG TPA: MFS transporter [Urbifossiella sp.]|jgi:MFS family permease|nr:MFS transporter [Urbifossiella sp.]
MATAVTEPAPAAAAAPAGRPPGELSVLGSWVNLVAAGVAYVCTNPSRAYGLGVITEPLLADFQISRTTFGEVNFWATMVVAVLSFGFGTLVDRLGIRRSFVVVLTLLAGATALLSAAHAVWTLFAAITLARLLGQGVLALVSTALLGKSTPRGAPMAAAVYLLLTSVLYAGVVQLTRVGLVDNGMSWREVWLVTAGVMLFGGVPVGLFAVTEPRLQPPDRSKTWDGPDRTLWQAVRSPLFLVYGSYCLMTSASGSGIALFNESLLKDRGFGRDVFFDSLVVGILSMVVFKFAIAWLCQRWSMGKVNAIGMLLSGASLTAVPLLQTTTDVYIWSIVKALAMGVHVVVYFSIWGYAFGRRDLAQIQGAVHVLTVTGSGVGPLLFAVCRDQFGSYLPCLNAFGALALVLGVCMLFVRVPCAEQPAAVKEVA